MVKDGLVLIISGPSAVGKSRVISHLLNLIPELRKTISATTRQARVDEIANHDYFFLSESGFEAAIRRNEFLQWVDTAFGRYGTPRQPLINWITAGQSVVMDLDPVGTSQIRTLLPRTCSIFLLPPSLAVLYDHLKSRRAGRGIRTRADLEQRLLSVKDYISVADSYDFVIINSNAEATASLVAGILATEELRIRKSTILQQWKQRELGTQKSNLIFDSLTK